MHESKRSGCFGWFLERAYGRNPAILFAKGSGHGHNDPAVGWLLTESRCKANTLLVPGTMYTALFAALTAPISRLYRACNPTSILSLNALPFRKSA